MIKRIIDISTPAYLFLKNQQLIIQNDDKTTSIPIEDIGIVILDNHSIRCTQGFLNACFENNTLVVISDKKHLPSAVLLPLSGHSIQSRILAIQCNITKPTQKKIWQEIIKAKIRAQARVLDSIAANAKYIINLIPKVRSGDPNNIEAQAARYYWQELFGKSFRRSDYNNNINHLLNYGYAIMRGACARAIVGGGLHPSIGIHHHNQYDSFCLADDLIEPLRPIVDMNVYDIINETKSDVTINKDIKAKLLRSLSMPCEIESRKLPLMVALHSYIASIRKLMAGEKTNIQIPRI